MLKTSGEKKARNSIKTWTKSKLGRFTGMALHTHMRFTVIFQHFICLVFRFLRFIGWKQLKMFGNEKGVFLILFSRLRCRDVEPWTFYNLLFIFLIFCDESWFTS